MLSLLTWMPLLLFNVAGSSGNPNNTPMIPPYNQQNVRQIFLEAILDTFGSNGSLDSYGLSSLLDNVVKFSAMHQEEVNSDKHITGDNITSANGTGLNSTDGKCQSFLHSEKWLPSCITEKCYNSSGMLQLFNFSSDKRLDSDDVLLISPAIIYQTYSCQKTVQTEEIQTKIDEAFAYGFLFVTLINICALVGVVVLPIMNTKIYKKVLLFLVALAVGSLAGTGFLVLIPKGFELVGDHYKGHNHLWMGTTIMGGIYLFFLIERFLKLILQWRQKNADKSRFDLTNNHQGLSDVVCSVKAKTPVDADTAKMKDPATYHASATHCASHITPTESVECITGNSKSKSTTELGIPEDISSKNSIETQDEKAPKQIRTVAWMIIFGDGLHNFIDGLSIGAAFTSSIMTGISVSVAVICEELPHELGDFAILLNSGMGLKKALLFNFLSACMCYFGLIIGILLGELTSAHRWVFGIAGGMFLYISLVDMMPEMNSVVEANENQELGTASMFLLQNIGMIVGFGIILILANYGDHIELSS